MHACRAAAPPAAVLAGVAREASFVCVGAKGVQSLQRQARGRRRMQKQQMDATYKSRFRIGSMSPIFIHTMSISHSNRMLTTFSPNTQTDIYFPSAFNMFLFNRLRYRKMQPIEQQVQGFVLVSNIPPLAAAAWDVCLLTKTLSTFLFARELCALSTCARSFVPFRRQFQILVSGGLIKALLKQMHSDTLWRVTDLYMSTRAETGLSRDDIGIRFPAGFRQMRNLRNLFLDGGFQFGLGRVLFILNHCLGAESKARLKHLALMRVFYKDAVHLSVAHFDALFVDLSGLETLALWQTGSSHVLLPSLAKQLEQGRLPNLRLIAVSLLPSDRDLDYHYIALLLAPILHGRVPHLKEIELSSIYFTDEYIDLLLQLFPLLQKLDLLGSSFTDAGQLTLREAAVQHPGLTLLLPPPRLKQPVQYPDPASLTSSASLSLLAAEVWHFFINIKSISSFLDLDENGRLSSCTSAFSPFHHQNMCLSLGKDAPDTKVYCAMRENILSEVTNLTLSDEYPFKEINMRGIEALILLLPRLDSLQIDQEFCLCAPFVLKSALGTAGKVQLKYLRVTGDPFDPAFTVSPSPSVVYTYASFFDGLTGLCTLKLEKIADPSLCLSSLAGALARGQLVQLRKLDFSDSEAVGNHLLSALLVPLGEGHAPKLREIAFRASLTDENIYTLLQFSSCLCVFDLRGNTFSATGLKRLRQEAAERCPNLCLLA